jgi:hypothetical protein
LKLIIVGSGRCVWDDLEQLHKFRTKEITDDVMCINDMIMFYPGDITHCVSCDAPMLPKWWAARRPPYKSQFSKVPRFHTVNNYQGVKGVETWEFQGAGTSGLLACKVGLELGYDEIILCGVPIDNDGHFWEAPWGKTNFQREIADSKGNIRGDGRKYWTRARDTYFEGRVTSMSGNTRKILGAPVGVYDNQ